MICLRSHSLGTNELSGGEDDDGDNGGLFQSSAHDNPPLCAGIRDSRARTRLTAHTGLALPAATKIRGGTTADGSNP